MDVKTRQDSRIYRDNAQLKALSKARFISSSSCFVHVDIDDLVDSRIVFLNFEACNRRLTGRKWIFRRLAFTGCIPCAKSQNLSSIIYNFYRLYIRKIKFQCTPFVTHNLIGQWAVKLVGYSQIPLRVFWEHRDVITSTFSRHKYRCFQRS